MKRAMFILTLIMLIISCEESEIDLPEAKPTLSVNESRTLEDLAEIVDDKSIDITLKPQNELPVLTLPAIPSHPSLLIKKVTIKYLVNLCLMGMKILLRIKFQLNLLVILA